MYERVQNLHCSLLGVHIVEWNAFAGDAGTPRNNNKANELKSKEYADRYTLHDNSIHSQINKIKYKYRKIGIKFLSEYYLCIIIIQKKIHNFQTKKSRRT